MEDKNLGDNQEKQESKDQFVTIDGKKVKIVNSMTLIQIDVHQLENGKEIQQVVAHEMFMTDHKPYMVHHLTEAINTVMKAVRRKSVIKTCSEAMFNKMMNGVKNHNFKRPRIIDKLRGK